MAVSHNYSTLTRDMWAQLNEKTPKSTFYSKCEKEVQLVLKHVDAMIATDYNEWQREQQKLQAKLDIKEQEHLVHKSTLEAKVSQLKSQIQGMEQSQKDISVGYEKQLNQLRTEVSNMRKDYERLQKKYNKHARQVQLDKNKQISDSDDNSGEIKRLHAKVEEYRGKSRDWDQERHDLSKQLEHVQSQNKTLQEKCQLIQHQADSYQSQLDKRKGMLDNTEQNLRSQIAQLENQLQRARDTINSQDTQFGRLKTSLDDAIAAQRKTMEEKETVEGELQKLHSQVRRIEDDNVHLRREVDAKGDMLSKSQVSLTSLNSEIGQLTNKLKDKDQVIHQLSDTSRQEVEERTNQLLGEIEQLRSSLKKHKRNEKQLLDETGMLQDKLDSSRRENSQLNQQITAKVSDEKLRESEEITALKSQLSMLKENFSHTRQAYETQLQNLRIEISDLTTDLHQRNVSIATLSEKSAAMEKQLRDHDDKLERKHAEMQVSQAQLEAVRLENRHLRRNVISHKSNSGDNEAIELAETEKHLKEIQAAYTDSVSTLESQNERLQGEILSLRDQLSSVENTTQHQVKVALSESQQSLHRAKQDQQRLLRETKLSGERQVQEVQDKLNDTINDYEKRIHDMRNEMSLLEDELEIQNRSMRRLGLENEVMSNFVEGIDTELQQKGRSNGYQGYQYQHSSARHTPQSLVDDDFTVDSADLATAQFLAEQNERTKELERKFDLHIEDLERSAEATLQKYISPR